jgi:hypothetical protein
MYFNIDNFIENSKIFLASASALVLAWKNYT